MASSKYSIMNGETLVKTVSKKPAEGDVRAMAKELGATLQVLTGAGNVVLEVRPRKPQVRTKQYTRVVELPEGTKIPEGKRVAYTRARKNAVILHDAEGAEGKQYSVFDFKAGKYLARNLPTTRAAGRFLADEVPTPEKANA